MRSYNHCALFVQQYAFPILYKMDQIDHIVICKKCKRLVMLTYRSIYFACNTSKLINFLLITKISLLRNNCNFFISYFSLVFPIWGLFCNKSGLLQDFLCAG